LSDATNNPTSAGGGGEDDSPRRPKSSTQTGRGGSGLTSDQTCLGCLIAILIVAGLVVFYLWVYWRNTPELSGGR
jgi:hypothetical protein